MPILHLICAWCLRSLGSRPCEAAQAGKLSHGICPSCAAAIEASIEAMPVAPAKAAA